MKNADTKRKQTNKIDKEFNEHEKEPLGTCIEGINNTSISSATFFNNQFGTVKVLSCIFILLLSEK